MRRWIVAILALQFFCSVSLFAYGQGNAGTACADADKVVFCTVNDASDLVQADRLSVLDTEHDLLDDTPDLPEGVDLALHRAAKGNAWNGPLAFEYPGLASPTLDGLRRPPRA